MFGLYDTEGILRFTCSDKETCVAYAELLDLPSDGYSLMDVPETKLLKVKSRQKTRNHRAKNNN